MDSTAASVALAGVINKSLGVQNQQQHKGGTGAHPCAAAAAAAGVQPEELLAAALPILTEPLQQQQQGAGGAVAAAAAAQALKALAWIARGLAQPRHDSWQNILQQYVLPVLQLEGTAVQEQPGTAAAAAVPSELVWAAAEFFAVLVAPVQPQGATASSSSSSSSTVVDASSFGHALSLHNMARPLWQQKVFVLALQALQSAAAAPTAGSTVLEPQQQQQQRQEQGLWLAMASLVSVAPAALPAAGQQQLLLLQCVVHLAQIWEAVSANSSSSSSSGQAGSSPAAATAADGSQQQVVLLQLLRSCLLMLGNALSSNGAAAEAEFGQHVELLLQTLCKLVQMQPVKPSTDNQQQQRRQAVQLAASVREAAVMCLTSCMSVPYHLLHPYRRSVLAAIMVALDDDRRAVRKAAVECRGVWASS
jgi:hypothetical protein